MNKIFILEPFPSDFLGFAFLSILLNQIIPTQKMKKVTGIGGIFFKCKDANKMREWYKTHLGFDANQYGASFEWREAEDPTKKELHNGRHLLKQQNTLSLPQKIL